MADNPGKVLFHRRYDRYSGGHQKVLDYFSHVEASEQWEPGIFWAEGSISMAETIWRDRESRRVLRYDPAGADLVFLAGMDWQAFLPLCSAADTPVINLIQHVRHADPEADVYPFLPERAVRICVSREVEEAILATGRVNGPTFTIPNGIDQSLLAGFDKDRTPGSVYLLGNKQPLLANRLALRLRGLGMAVSCHAEHMPRQQVLEAMAAAEICVLLPHETEGFYLPALEAMALGALTVVPDCVGNRSFCTAGVNCLMPGLDLDALCGGVLEARHMLAHGDCLELLDNARHTVTAHGLQRERSSFFEILDNMDRLW